MKYKMNGFPQMGNGNGNRNGEEEEEEQSQGMRDLNSLRDSRTIDTTANSSSLVMFDENLDGGEWYYPARATPAAPTVEPSSSATKRISKKPMRKSMDKMESKDYNLKSKKTTSSIKTPPKAKVKYNLYSSASQLGKQGKSVGYTETSVPGAKKVLRQNMSMATYENRLK